MLAQMDLEEHFWTAWMSSTSMASVHRTQSTEWMRTLLYSCTPSRLLPLTLWSKSKKIHNSTKPLVLSQPPHHSRSCLCQGGGHRRSLGHVGDTPPPLLIPSVRPRDMLRKECSLGCLGCHIFWSQPRDTYGSHIAK